MIFHQLTNEFVTSRGRFEAHTRPPTSLTDADSPLTKILANKTVFLSCDETVDHVSVGCGDGDGVGVLDVGWFGLLLHQLLGAVRAGRVWQGEGLEEERVAVGLTVPGVEVHLGVGFWVGCSCVG